MDNLPELVLMSDSPGADYVEQFQNYVDHIYQIYLREVVNANLQYRGEKVTAQRRPQTHGKDFAFWHMMQEGEIEDDRTIDFERCERVRWISYLIRNSAVDIPELRVFPQNKRKGNRSWVLWLVTEDYALILWERKDYFLLKTAFLIKYKGKVREFERDWKKHLTTL